MRDLKIEVDLVLFKLITVESEKGDQDTTTYHSLIGKFVRVDIEHDEVISGTWWTASMGADRGDWVKVLRSLPKTEALLKTSTGELQCEPFKLRVQVDRKM